MRMVGCGCVGCRFCGCVRACVGCLLPGKSYWDQGEKCFVSELLFGFFSIYLQGEVSESVVPVAMCEKKYL